MVGHIVYTVHPMSVFLVHIVFTVYAFVRVCEGTYCSWGLGLGDGLFPRGWKWQQARLRTDLSNRIHKWQIPIRLHPYVHLNSITPSPTSIAVLMYSWYQELTFQYCQDSIWGVKVTASGARGGIRNEEGSLWGRLFLGFGWWLVPRGYTG